MNDRNTAVDLLHAVTAAYAGYDPEPDGDYTGKVVAVQCADKQEAKRVVKAMEGAFLAADKIEHDGLWYAYVTDLRGSDPDDVVFELGWHDFHVGTIPDPSIQ